MNRARKTKSWPHATCVLISNPHALTNIINMASTGIATHAVMGPPSLTRKNIRAPDLRPEMRPVNPKKTLCVKAKHEV